MSTKCIYLAGGCFWGTQKFFDQFEGVLETEVGYANGPTTDPSYQEVCRSSGHAETVRIVYDPAVVSLTQLLDWYFLTVDPTAYHRQGGDMGVQYRTGIYYTEPEQLPEIETRYAMEQAKYKQPLLVELQPMENFYPAEAYHQKYLDKNPSGYCHISPELLHLAGE
jgi:methionine-S-sulfoxide reductase